MWNYLKLIGVLMIALLCGLAVPSSQSDFFGKNGFQLVEFESSQHSVTQTLVAEKKRQKLPVVELDADVQKDFIEKLNEQLVELEGQEIELHDPSEGIDYFPLPIVTYGNPYLPNQVEFGKLLLDYSIEVDERRMDIRVNGDGSVDIQQSALSDSSEESVRLAIEKHLADNDIWQDFLASLDGKYLDWNELDGNALLPPETGELPSETLHTFPHQLLQERGAPELRQYVRSLVCEALEACGHVVSQPTSTPVTAI